jgi:hypothetical protein
MEGTITKRVSATAASAVLLLFTTSAHAQSMKVCNSTFALCTIAPCDPVPGSDKEVACHCTVNHGYSTGAESCTSVRNTPEGQEIHSRYYPVKSYAI